MNLVTSEQISLNPERYLTASGFRKPGLVIATTQDELTELAKAKADIVYFAETWCKFPQTGAHIVLRDYQKELLRNFEDKRSNIVSASRQVGVSLMIKVKLLHSFVFGQNISMALIYHKLQIGVGGLEDIQQMYQQLPIWMQSGIVNKSRKMFQTETGNVIFALSNIIAGRSIDIAVLENLDNATFEKAQIALFPAVTATNGQIIISQTGGDCYGFTKIWNDATGGANSFVPTRILWWQVAGRDENWKQQEIKNLGSEELFDQEYNLKFTAK